MANGIISNNSDHGAGVTGADASKLWIAAVSRYLEAEKFPDELKAALRSLAVDSVNDDPFTRWMAEHKATIGGGRV